MMYVTKEIACKMEGCIKTSHIAVTKQYARGRIFEINGGAACFSGQDSFLSQVVGWGFFSKPAQFAEEISQIEQFYRSLGHSRVDVELCPFVGNALAVFLSNRGYTLSELSNVSVLDLTHYQPAVLEQDLPIREIKTEEFAYWAKQVALGFGYPEAKSQFMNYLKARGVLAFAAFDQDKIVAGATLALHEEVCDLGVTSTLAAYRGRGLQKKLLLTRLNKAKEQGLSLATVTTEPGSISDLNIQKTGFVCAYTRIKMTLSSL